MLLTIQDKVIPGTYLINGNDRSLIFQDTVSYAFYVIAGICIFVWCEMYISDYRQMKRDQVAQQEYKKI